MAEAEDCIYEWKVTVRVHDVVEAVSAGLCPLLEWLTCKRLRAFMI